MESSRSPQISIERMMEEDWPAVREIYLEGIRTGNATFETQVPEWGRWNASHLRSCRFVALAPDQADSAPDNLSARQVLGWSALSAVSSRCVYAGVAEVSVYVAVRARGMKIGSMLMAALVNASESEGIWTLQAGVFPENIASIQLHKRFGFRVVGRRERIGCMNGLWRDTLLLERRSSIVGS